MKKLITALFLIMKSCQPAMAQAPEFTTYFDTTYWFSNESGETYKAPEFKLDTMSGNRYGKYSQFALKYVESVFGTKVGDGLCGRVGEEMCRKAYAEMVHKGRVTTDLSILEVGDIIVFPQFLEFRTLTGHVSSSTPAEHLVMFMGMKNDSVMLIAHQNTEGNTYNTKVVIGEVYWKGTRFFKGNNHKPYFDVYGYEMRKVLKSEYSFLSGKK